MGRIFPAALIFFSFLACTKKQTPEDGLKSLRFSDAFEAGIFAAEPMVLDPVDMVFDERGRAYVADMLDLPWDPPQGKKARSRIVLLEDSDGDGRADRSTVFAENVLQVSGLIPWKGGLIVPAAPEILYLKDTDGDGKADLREVLFTGFFQGNPEAQITNPRLGLDGWIYFSNTGNAGRITSPKHPHLPPVEVRGADFRFHPVRLLAEAASGAAQFGSTFDDFGNRFISQNTQHVRHVVLPMEYLARAPMVEIPNVNHDPYGSRERLMWPLTQPQDWRVKRTAMRQKRYDENKTGRIEHVGGHISGAAGGTIYNGDAWPEEYYGNLFTGDVSGNLVRRDILRPDGVTFSAAPAREGVEFLASTDQWFRPTSFANAPDGNFYLTDMYREIIETPLSIPEELRKDLDFYSGDTKGRIYRIVSKRVRTARPLAADLGTRTAAELVNLLEHPNGWHRETARRLLLERQDATIAAALRAVESPIGKVAALWLLENLGALTEADVKAALAHPHPRVREHAVKLSEKFPLLPKMADDPDPRVRFQFALTLGTKQGPEARAMLAAIANRDSADPWIRSAVLLSSADWPAEMLSRLRKPEPDLERRLAALIGIRKNPSEIASALPRLSDAGFEGLARGLQLAGARNLHVPGAERAGERAWTLARFLSLPALTARAESDALNEKLDPARRARVLAALQGGPYAKALALLEKLLAASAPGQVQAAAVDTVASFAEESVAADLLKHWKRYAPEARQRVVAALVERKPRAEALLTAIEKGGVEAGMLEVNVRNRLIEEFPRARSVFRNAAGDRAAVVAAYRDVAKLNGDPVKGKEYFEDACAKCHMPRRQGGRVGPDLSGINNKTREELLEAILNPSASIEPRFVNYIVTTKDGRNYDGVLASETPGAITLRGGAVEDVTVLRADIAGIRASSISLMPEDLEKGLSKQAMADLISYLRGGN
jgi:putative membrane-bound dehydrogenase-like protein